MIYRVVVLRLAASDLDDAYRWAAGRAPLTAARWFARLHEAMQSLSSNPQRCPLAPEDGKVACELREFLFGRRPNTFRIIFTIQDDIVRILRSAGRNVADRRGTIWNRLTTPMRDSSHPRRSTCLEQACRFAYSAIGAAICGGPEPYGIST